MNFKTMIFITALFSLLILVLEFHNSIDNQVSAQTYPYIASTRGLFDLDYETNIQQTNLPSALNILNIENCPAELAIYVHGVWATEEEAEEQTDRASLSLKKIGYDIPLIGFSWDSNTPFSLDNLQLSMYGWDIAKIIANSNGPILGKFIQQFKENCPDDEVRIIAHSLGSRVTLSSIQWLHENSNPNEPKKITSVHLLGAAIDDEQVSLNEQQCVDNQPPLPCSGEAIEHIVDKFYNLYNHEDNMLALEEFTYFYWLYPYIFTVIYPSPYIITENDYPLGAYGIQDNIVRPGNYEEFSVLPMIIYQENSDQRDGCDLKVNLKHFGYIFGNLYLCTINKEGDNHFGYMGFRDFNDEIEYEGAINMVVNNWIS